VLVDEDDVSAVGFAIADNRTAQLAEWDEEVLGRLMKEVEVGEEGLQVMFADLAKDLDLIAGDVAPPADGASDTAPDRYQVVVTCANEDAQKQLLERLAGEGFDCRGLIV